MRCGLDSASSYLLGLTPLPFKPFFVGTIGAMAIWGPLYASIGSASRALLVNGGDVGELVAGVLAFGYNDCILSVARAIPSLLASG